MNLINKILLGIALAPRRLYAGWGVDTRRLSAILSTKLIMDDRRPNTLQLTRGKQNPDKEITAATLGTMFLSGLVGLVYLLVFRIGNDYLTQFTLLFSMFIPMLCMMLVSDFTSVLIDVRDNYIILPKPVNDATVVVARLLHVFVHLCKLVFPMCLPAIVYLGVTAPGGAALIFFLLALFATLFSIFLINAVYIFILRISTPERFKNIIAYIQIVFAIALYAGSQLVPRWVGEADMEGYRLADSVWLLAAPPYWFACAFDVLSGGRIIPQTLIGGVLAIAVPLACVYVVVRYLAPAFNQKIAMIGGGEAVQASAAGGPKTTGAPAALPERLARLFTGTPAERTGFLFTWKMMARSRDFKVKVYPGIGYMLVFVFVVVFRGTETEDVDFNAWLTGFRYLAAVYMSSLVLMIAILQMAFSDKFKAVWMFYLPPVQRPGHIVAGAVKAAVCRFYLPLAAALILVGAWFGGVSILPNLVLALCNQLVIAFAVAVMFFRQLPFSQPFDNAQKGEQTMRTVLFLLLAGLIAVIHFFVFQRPLAIGVMMVLSVFALWLLHYHIRKQTWDDMARQQDW